MPTLVFSSAALGDLAGIEARIAQRSASAEIAEKFANSILEKCSHLAAFATRVGRPRLELLPDLRSFPFGAYVIFFRYVGESFYVVNILHAARDIDALFAEHDNDRE